jgi:hypothetical protein
MFSSSCTLYALHTSLRPLLASHSKKLIMAQAIDIDTMNGKAAEKAAKSEWIYLSS